jgi:hypothetical protein
VQRRAMDEASRRRGQYGNRHRDRAPCLMQIKEFEDSRPNRPKLIEFHNILA